MYGAILGDIIGSQVEFTRPKGFDSAKAELFTNKCTFTDDTVLTVATKYAVLHGISFERAYAMFGRRYKKAGYGNMFLNWLDSGIKKPYGSYGNGAAMRISFIGEHFGSLKEVEEIAKESAVCTHDHEEGYKAAMCAAGAVFMARNGADKKEIKEYFSKKYNYQTNIPLNLIRPFTKFDSSAMASMPLVIRCFLESENYETCVRNVLSLKCDADTIACISGAIAENFYGTTGIKNEDDILKRYLIRPNKMGVMDDFLFINAVSHPENYPESKIVK
ncbi:MAG: ADP-ribosylglycohydrolase family protein [Ruminococcaceae bacterium]|nr:ADP-ribosylglycohydrolase family protein [Oscillospiraceae bacterium]